MATLTRAAELSTPPPKRVRHLAGKKRQKNYLQQTKHFHLLSQVKTVCGAQQSIKVLKDLFQAIQLSCPEEAKTYQDEIMDKWSFYIQRHRKEPSTTKGALCHVLCTYGEEKSNDTLNDEIASIVGTNYLQDGNSFDANHGLGPGDSIVFDKMFAEKTLERVAATCNMDVQKVAVIHRIYLNSFKRACFPFIGKTHFPVHALFALLEFPYQQRLNIYNTLKADKEFEGKLLKPTSEDPDGITTEREDKKSTDTCDVLMHYYKLYAGRVFYCSNKRFWDLVIRVCSYIGHEAYWASLSETLRWSVRNQMNNHVLVVEQQVEDLQDFLIKAQHDDLSIAFDLHMNSDGDMDWAKDYISTCLASTAWMMNQFCTKQTKFDDYGICTDTCGKEAVWAGLCWSHSQKYVMSQNYLPSWWIYHVRPRQLSLGVEPEQMDVINSMLKNSLAVEKKIQATKTQMKKKGSAEPKIVGAKKAMSAAVCNIQCASCVCVKSNDFDFYTEGGTRPEGVVYPPRPTSQQLSAHKELRGYKLPHVHYGLDDGPIAAKFLKRATGEKDKVRIAFEKKCLYCGYINWWLNMEQCGGEKCENFLDADCFKTKYLKSKPELFTTANNETTPKLLLCPHCMEKAEDNQEKERESAKAAEVEEEEGGEEE